MKNGKRRKNRGLKDLILKVNNELFDLDLSDDSQSATLPSEILAIVAAHLTGQLAFGSTANLNLACKAVHHETLPVLWETFFFSHDPPTSKGKAAIRKLPAGIRHTKYIFFATEIDYDAETDERGDFEHLERMPNVVMTVASDSGELVMDSDETWIRLYRPVSSATAFRILGTPFRQAVIVDHADCSMFHGAFATGGMQARECRAQAMKPAVRALVTIQNLVLESGAYLHDRHPFHLPPIKTNLRLFKTDIVSSDVETRGSSFDSKPTVTTLVELMKLAAMQKIRAHLYNIEMGLLMREQMMMMVKYPACVHLPVSKEWHASVVLDKSGMLNLIEKVRVLASDTPHILQNRLDVTITDSMEGATCLDMFDKVSKLYTIHIRSIEDDLLPSRTDNPTVLRCRRVLEDHRKDRSGQALPSGKRSHEKAMWVTVELSERPGGVAAKVRVVEA